MHSLTEKIRVLVNTGFLKVQVRTPIILGTTLQASTLPVTRTTRVA